MADSEDLPLDEIQWRSPQVAQNMGGIQTNTVLPYFSESPFFDKTSNNATLSTQAMYNPAMFHLIQTREAFEGRLRSMAGMEFMVTHDPSNNGHHPENSGVWVIRKQNRRKRNGMEDEITPLNSYFVIGENVYMAPSVGTILGGRMLSTVTSLTKMLSTASALPIFTPSLGYTYIPPVPKAITVATSFQATQSSKGDTPIPDTQTSLNSKGSFASEKAPAADVRGTALLSESFALASKYRTEYMDENPLVGEPGSFIVQKIREAPLLSQPQASNKSLVSAKPSAPPTPSPLKTEGLPSEPMRGLRTGEKTPITPGTKDKKRKKSKVVTTTTPK